MLKRYRRNRRLRRLKEINNPVIGIAMQCLDRPTDLKDEFSLRQKLDLDNLHAHAEAAQMAESIDSIVGKDIRLATLRAFCTMDAIFVFQCLSAMPEMLNDERAIRSLHTYLQPNWTTRVCRIAVGCSGFYHQKESPSGKGFSRL